VLCVGAAYERTMADWAVGDRAVGAART